MNAQQEEAGKKTAANPRNLAAGTLRQLDSRVVKKRGLKMLVFNVQDARENGADLMESHTGGLEILQKNGVACVPHTLCETPEQVLAAIDAIRLLESDLAKLCRWTVAVLAIGALAGATSWWAAGGAGAVGDAVSGGAGVAPGLTFRVAAVALLCLFTGVFEEGVFRVLALDAFALAFGTGRRNGYDATVSGSIAFKSAGPWPRGMLKAAIASSALFGILHVSAVDAAAAGSAVAWAQFALKPVQAGLFGFFMAALFMRTGSLWDGCGRAWLVQPDVYRSRACDERPFVHLRYRKSRRSCAARNDGASAHPAGSRRRAHLRKSSRGIVRTPLDS